MNDKPCYFDNGNNVMRDVIGCAITMPGLCVVFTCIDQHSSA